MVGRTVVRKCCDRNDIFSLEDLMCMNNQGLATQYFDDLQSTANNELFFRIGMKLNCPYKQQTTEFRLVSGSLQVRMNAESDWNEQLISAENYCLEDFVMSPAHSAGLLPETENMALFCVSQATPVEEFAFPVDPINLDNISTINYEIQEKIDIPKCCLPGYVVEGETCQPLMLHDSEFTITNALNQYLREIYNISSILVPNTSLSCGYEKTLSLLPSPGSLAKLKFQFHAERNTSLSIHIYKINDWDFEFQTRDFCVDFTRFHSNKEVSYYPEVFYCDPASSFSVSMHYPILLSISAAALLATFIIYFFVPASGNR